MLKKERIENFNEEQKFSPPDDKKPSSKDFAAGKTVRGILKGTQRDDIQDIDHGKEHDNIGKRKKITFGGDEIITIDSLDKNIKIKDDTSFAEYLEYFEEIVKNTESAFEDTKQLLTKEDFYKRCGSDLLDFKVMSHKSEKEKIINMYNDGKKQGSKELIDTSFELIDTNTNRARSILDNLNQLRTFPNSNKVSLSELKPAKSIFFQLIEKQPFPGFCSRYLSISWGSLKSFLGG